jgi:uncharacterized membrane protein YphA (DoxX/SURF4 family)
MTKLTKTEMPVNMMDALGLSFLASPGIIQTLGVVLLLVGIALIAGWQVTPIGWALTVFFTVSTLAGLFAGDAPFTVGPAIWKDFALIGASLGLAFGGAGAYSVDTS